ncbi:MAG: hypothetical protein KME30_25490 [Iphinoe sp. HA4291-MV1]|jgi:hypothetical protein|nr:hypothetical protein [Iphinoe sp. HA4291-MV1]
MSLPIQRILINQSLLFFLILYITSCSSKKSTEELTKELETVSSWTATAHMVSEAWLRDAVPTAYAQQTLKTTQKELQKETDNLSKLSIPPKQQQTTLKLIQELKYTVGQMSAAVEQKDRSAIATQLKQLLTEEQTIHKLVKPAGEKP